MELRLVLFLALWVAAVVGQYFWVLQHLTAVQAVVLAVVMV
jgi:hypothetical protein